MHLQLSMAVSILFASVGSLAEAPANSLVRAPDKEQALEQDDLVILKRHYPFYFAFGNPLSKVQLSFKALLYRPLPIYFGYTQLMFWELLQDSKPFRDLTYNPELFYRLDLGKELSLRRIDFGAFNHTSNGKAGSDSRSFNRSYVRLQFEKELTRWLFRLTTEISYLYDFDETNRDIRDFVSPFALEFSFIQLFEGWIDKGELTLQLRPGGHFGERWDRGGYQLSYAFRLGGLQVVPAFYLQYYMGYAETLLNYNQNVHTVRAGLIF